MQTVAQIVGLLSGWSPPLDVLVSGAHHGSVKIQRFSLWEEMMADLADLPKDFDPEKHVANGPAKRSRAKPLSDGLRLIDHDAATGFYSLTRVQRTPTAEITTRCWHCYKRPDGSFDCFEVTCPWN
jgi:hypothetical protein